ncbi:pilus assembly protein CpaF [Pararobbsia alpina]|uniref:ATPase, T2SS/T4P/T4SS family n=1 Tax=Pararobbsia alpina TaxID=621374 RepID=UPI0039A73F17
METNQQVQIEVTGRDGKTQAYALGTRATLGKDPSCDIVLKGLLIGKVQASIESRHGHWYIEDRGGIASTLVNGNPITSYGPLTETDQIEIAAFKMVVRNAPASAAVSGVAAHASSTTASGSAATSTSAAAPAHPSQDRSAHDAHRLHLVGTQPGEMPVSAQAASLTKPVTGAHPQAATQRSAPHDALRDRSQEWRPVATREAPSVASATLRTGTDDMSVVAGARGSVVELGVEHRAVAGDGTSSAPVTARAAPSAPPSQRAASSPARPASSSEYSQRAQPGSTASTSPPAPPVTASPPSAAPRPQAAAPSDVQPDVVWLNTPEGIELRKTGHSRLISAIDLRRLNVARMSEHELSSTIGSLLRSVLASDPVFESPDIPTEVLFKSIFDEVIGLGPLESLLADETITEIMVNRYNEIFIERAGQLSASATIFTDDQAVLGAIERIVAPLGRRIDESSPMVDARLKDGSRVNAVIPPLALKGPNITIRKFSKRKLQGEDLVRFGSLSPQMVAFLRVAVERRANIVISGGTGSGKTTLLNVLSNFIPDSERIVTVEDAAELQLTQSNLVSLEARPPNMEGKGAVSIRDLVKNTLRMRPDRIVVGECRGGEALDMLQAMNTGHDGSLTTAHANSPRDCLSRLEVMTLMAGLDLPVNAIREQVVSAVDLIVQQTRFSCGTRRVTHITEVSGIESGTVQLQDVFVFKQTGYGDDGRVQGTFHSTGYVPDFYQDLIRRGITVDTSIFAG